MACTCNGIPCTCAGQPSSGGRCRPKGPTATQAPANTQPLTSLECTLLARLQPAIDAARLQAHRIGARPYRVRLVWQTRDQFSGKWSEAYSLELVPVRVRNFGDIGQQVTPAGTGSEGQVSVEEVSLAQVDYDTLQGKIDGKPWQGSDREFFYEIQQIRQCASDPEPKRIRMIPLAEPELDAQNSQWRVRLIDQFGDRSDAGRDQTVPGEFYDPGPARLVP